MRWAALLDVFFPSACVECDAAGVALCSACFGPAPPLRFAIDDIACSALGTYDGVLRRAVLALKSGRRDVGDALGALLAPCLVRAEIDALVPVPTTAARRRERGFDQGELLARVAGREASVAVAPVLRQRAGDAQRGRTRSERLAAAGRFACDGASLGIASRVLLVDDVATTGATLRDCATALRSAGLRVVGAVVVARACEERARASSKEPNTHAEGRLERLEVRP